MLRHCQRLNDGPMLLEQLGVAAVFPHRGEPRRPHAKIPELEQGFAAGAALVAGEQRDALSEVQAFGAVLNQPGVGSG